MLSCMLGNNREIFFPRLEKEQMMTFDKIATELLEKYGYDILECESDVEAIEKTEELKNGSKFYPVHYADSNTSGEKSYEEFYTEIERVDFERFSALGVITDKVIPDRYGIDVLFRKLNMAFDKAETAKAEVIEIIKNYLPIRR